MDVNKIFHRLAKAGEDWADREAAASLLEETKHTVLSQIMSGAPDEFSSNASKETWARSTADFKEHLEKMVEARRIANRAKVNWQAQCTWSELKRTAEASRRAEMKI